ncbi:hypothetical protein DFH09DRAFT_1311773 [Mycena vulgaris]|nr:hypothetical protein DFH09DRAFT_1311773 [Mycena vulgaris]
MRSSSWGDLEKGERFLVLDYSYVVYVAHILDFSWWLIQIPQSIYSESVRLSAAASLDDGQDTDNDEEALPSMLPPHR